MHGRALRGDIAAVIVIDDVLIAEQVPLRRFGGAD